MSLCLLFRTILEKIGLQGKVSPPQAKKEKLLLKFVLILLLLLTAMIDFLCLRIASIQGQERG